MSSRDARRLTEQAVIPDDLDQLLREAVRGQMGGAIPPDHVWQKIEHQLRGGPSPIRRRASSRARTTAPLAQALALASLVVVFALSLGQNLSWSLLLDPYCQERSVQPTVAGQSEWSSPSDEWSATSVRQEPLLAKERALEKQMSLGTLPHAEVQGAGRQLGQDRTLSKRENLQLSREQASEQEENSSDDSSRMASVPPRYREDVVLFGEGP